MKAMGLILGGFIFIIIAVVLIQALSNNIVGTDTKATLRNESITVVSNAWTSLANKPIDIVYSVTNATSGTTIFEGNFTGANLDKTNGRINVTSPSGLYYVNYTYLPSLYVDNTTSKTLLNLIIVFFAIAIIIGVFFYLKETGIFEYS